MSTQTRDIVQAVENAGKFVFDVCQELSRMGVSVGKEELVPDHVCYRTATREEYDRDVEKMRPFKTIEFREGVAGRPVTLFRLKVPIEAGDDRIWILELPAPKEGSPYPRGLEHVDFLVPGTLEEFMVAHPGLEFDTRNLSKGKRPEVSLPLSNGKAAKFATIPAKDLIR